MFGDDVEFETIFGNQAIINEIYERKNYLKRPKVSNITQVIFVISPKSPKTNFLMLDKELCYAEYIGIKQAIAINKTDLFAGNSGVRKINNHKQNLKRTNSNNWKNKQKKSKRKKHNNRHNTL